MQGRFWYVPAGFFKTNIFQNTELSQGRLGRLGGDLDNIPHGDRIGTVAQGEPQRIRAVGFDGGPRLVILQLYDGDARSMRRPAKLLALRFLQTVDLVYRHISIYSLAKQFAMECFNAAACSSPARIQASALA